MTLPHPPLCFLKKSMGWLDCEIIELSVVYMIIQWDQAPKFIMLQKTMEFNWQAVHGKFLKVV